MTYIGELDQKFIAVDQEVLFVIIMAPNYLDIGPLLCVVSPSICTTFSFPILSRSDVGRKTVTDPGEDLRRDQEAPPPTLLITSLRRWLARRVDSTLLLIHSKSLDARTLE